MPGRSNSDLGFEDDEKKPLKKAKASTAKGSRGVEALKKVSTKGMKKLGDLWGKGGAAVVKAAPKSTTTTTTEDGEEKGKGKGKGGSESVDTTMPDAMDDSTVEPKGKETKKVAEKKRKRETTGGEDSATAEGSQQSQSQSQTRTSPRKKPKQS